MTDEKVETNKRGKFAIIGGDGKPLSFPLLRLIAIIIIAYLTGKFT